MKQSCNDPPLAGGGRCGPSGRSPIVTCALHCTALHSPLGPPAGSGSFVAEERLRETLGRTNWVAMIYSRPPPPDGRKCSRIPHPATGRAASGPTSGRWSRDLHCTALHCTALHPAQGGANPVTCPAHCAPGLLLTALHCTAPHCTLLHCTALHRGEFSRGKLLEAWDALSMVPAHRLQPGGCTAFPHPGVLYSLLGYMGAEGHSNTVICGRSATPKSGPNEGHTF
jgi:hypothetical protein